MPSPAEAPAAPARPPIAVGRTRKPLTVVRLRRALYALTFLGLVLLVGTLGFHIIAGLGWVNSFYFESMLATGQGPPLTLTSDSSKLYAAVMAFVSVGSTLTTVFFAIGPVAARLWHEAAERIEEDARRFEEDVLPRRRP